MIKIYSIKLYRALIFFIIYRIVFKTTKDLFNKSRKRNSKTLYYFFTLFELLRKLTLLM